MLAIIVSHKVDADPTGKEPLVIHVPIISQPQILLQMSTNPQSANFHGSGNMTDASGSNAHEVMLLKNIDDTEHELQKPDLDTNYQHALQWMLSRNKAELFNHRAQVQQNLDFIRGCYKFQ